jgi:hypothetical protein
MHAPLMEDQDVRPAALQAEPGQPRCLGGGQGHMAGGECCPRHMGWQQDGQGGGYGGVEIGLGDWWGSEAEGLVCGCGGHCGASWWVEAAKAMPCPCPVTSRGHHYSPRAYPILAPHPY